MAWQGSTRRSRLPADWARIRRRIIRRDKVCVWAMSDGTQCGATGTDVDHITPGDDHRDDNLQLLCTWHHRRKSAQEGGTAAGLTRVRTGRPKPAHPALED